MGQAVIDPDVDTDKSAQDSPGDVDRAFTDGFGSPEAPTTTPAAPSTEPPSDSDTSAPTSEPPQGKTQPTTEPSNAAGSEPDVVQLTKEEWQKTQDVLATLQAQVKRGLDEAHGKIGGLQQLVQQLKTATPKGQKIQVTAEDFAELKQDFPELAEMQLKGLNRVLEKLVGTGASDPQQPTQPIQPSPPPVDVPAIRQQIIEDIKREELTDDHPDWREIVGLPKADGEAPPNTEFRQWVATKPKEEQEKIWSSWNPRFLAKTITDFKQSKQQPKPTADADARRQRLQSAVVPKGAGGGTGGGSAQTEEQAFLEGFKS